jgi:hypothetical protein
MTTVDHFQRTVTHHRGGRPRETLEAWVEGFSDGL